MIIIKHNDFTSITDFWPDALEALLAHHSGFRWNVTPGRIGFFAGGKFYRSEVVKEAVECGHAEQFTRNFAETWGYTVKVSE